MVQRETKADDDAAEAQASTRLTVLDAGYGTVAHQSFLDMPARLNQARAHPRVFDAWRLGNLHYNFARETKNCWVALRGREPVGRIAALQGAASGGLDVVLGFFECDDDPEAAQLLFESAMDWARAVGATRVVGPMSFGVDDSMGVLVGGFEERPFGGTAHSAPYYERFWISAGFTLLEAFRGWNLLPGPRNAAGRSPTRLASMGLRLAKSSLSSMITVRQIPTEQFCEFNPLSEFIQRVQEDQGITSASVEQARGWLVWLQIFFRPELVLIAEYERDVVGLIYATADVTEGLNPSANWVETQAHMRAAHHTSNAIRVQGIITLTERRTLGVTVQLLTALLAALAERGQTTYAEASQISTTNTTMNATLAGMGAVPHKTWHVYQMDIK